MAYVNNGNYRCKILNVDKKLNGISMVGYPKEYYITATFNEFLALSDEQFQQLSDADYQTRLAAFYQYIDAQEGDIDSANYIYAEGEEPYGEDIVSCPIGE